ncbi:MAG: hypothetical protein K6C11_01350 [Bacilli bacterium]|nr:hypothetical protein [Bacilli bacterium]
MKYYRTTEGDIFYSTVNESIDIPGLKSSNNIADLLEEGDLVKIEYTPRYSDMRKTGLFVVDVIMWDGNLISLRSLNTYFQILDGEFTCKKDAFHDYNPIITTVITHQKLESIEFTTQEVQEHNKSL